MVNVLLIGSGGVGTIASLALERSENVQVTSVLRSDYSRVSENGFKIKSPDYGDHDNWKPTHVVSSITEAKNAIGEKNVFDYIVVCTKVLPEVVKTEDIIADAVSPGITAIVLIQNGIYIEEPVAKVFPNNIVLSGVSMIGAINRHGYIEQFEHDSVEIGYWPSSTIPHDAQVAKAKEFVSLYGSKSHYNDDILFSRWRKLVYNSTLNTVAALTHLDTGRLYLSSLDRTVVIPAMKEIILVANKALEEHNKSLPEDIDIKMLHSDDGIYYKPSMFVDIEKGNPVELEVILGNPLREAKILGIETPILSVIYKLLKGVQFGLLEKRGYIKCPEKPPLREHVPPIWNDEL